MDFRFRQKFDRRNHDLNRILAAAGVETVLVAPEYAARASADAAGVIRVASGSVPRDPEDRRMHWGALQQTLQGLNNREFDLVHVHTPFLAHYAGVRYARARGIPVVETYHTFFEEYLHHYLPLLPGLLHPDRWLLWLGLLDRKSVV